MALLLLQADVEAAHSRIHRLQEDLAGKESQIRNKLNAHELQLKEQIVYNVSWMNGCTTL